MARSFDGSNDYYEYAHDAQIDVGTSDFALVVWLNLSTATENGRIISKGTSSGGTGAGVRYEVYLRNTPLIIFAIDDNVSKREAQYDPTSELDSTWHCWIFERDQGSTIRIYLDGNTQVGTQSDTANDLNNGNSLVLMAGRTTGDTIGSFTSGAAAELSLFKRLLLGSEKDAIGAGYSADFFGPDFYAPVIRPPEDKWAGISVTTGDAPAIASHPAITYPNKKFYIATPSAAPAANIPEFMHHYQQQHQAG